MGFVENEKMARLLSVYAADKRMSAVVFEVGPWRLSAALPSFVGAGLALSLLLATPVESTIEHHERFSIPIQFIRATNDTQQRKDSLSRFSERTGGHGFSIDTIIPFFVNDSHGFVHVANT